MNCLSLAHGPVTLLSLGAAPLESIDLLGRHKVLAHGLEAAPESMANKAATSAFAEVEVNHFRFKSLSCWSYNIAVGCLHGCRFCYVPASQHTQPGKIKQNTGPLASALRE